jgi:hypothetical protein
MKRLLSSLCVFALTSTFANGQVVRTPAVSATVPGTAPTLPERIAPRELVGLPTNRKVEFTQPTLSFEPNIGQSSLQTRFTARGAGYMVELDSSRAVVHFAGSNGGIKGKSLAIEMVDTNGTPRIQGEGKLPGVDSYFPSSNQKTWFRNIPTYSRVTYSAVYPGIDLAFDGRSNRLEYDFLVEPKADPSCIHMKFSGSEEARIGGDGSLVLQVGKQNIRLLAPMAYQPTTDGRGRESVSAAYRLDTIGTNGATTVSLLLGAYDHTRALVIDPALVYAQYVDGYVADVTVDGSGNTYVTGQNSNDQGFYVTEYSPTGTVLYNTTVGSSTIFPFHIRVDSSGNAYVAGYIYSGATLPTGSNSYKSTVTSQYNGFLVKIAAGGASVPYATYIGGADAYSSAAVGLGVQTVNNITYAFLSGWTQSSTFSVTSGVYQEAFSGSEGNYNGWIAKFDPAASGAASLAYSTYLGPAGTQLGTAAADTAGNVYVGTNSGPAGYPVTPGAFTYSGSDATQGGAYVSKLNPTGSSLVYSAYLGYGAVYGLAIEGQASPSVYVTGPVYYEDFPTTSGAYQTTYPAGFVAKLSGTGSTEVYSTFLGGPSSEANNNSVVPWSIAVPYGCQSSCDAYVSGYTSDTDFPTISALQDVESTAGASAFLVQLNATGSGAVLSSYLSGIAGYIQNGALASNSYAYSPALAVDTSGNISVVGNLGGTSDFPVTISTTNPGYAFLAKVGTSTLPYSWATPTSVNFGNVTVGVSTSVTGATATASVRNLSATTTTISSIVASPSSIFSATDGCAGTIPAGGVCVISINFAPTAPGQRAGTISVNSNASDSPTVISVTGNGVDNAYTVASATALTFNSQNVGTSSSPQLVTLTNLGDATAVLNIYAPYLGPDYAATDNCPSQLAPSGSCVVEVIFTPTQAGLRQGTLYIQGGGGPTISIPLNGTGAANGAVGTIGFNAPSFQFGTQVVGTTSAYQNVYVENNSNVPFSISSIATSGDFSIYSTNCGTLPIQLNQQSSCIVYVNFTPSAAGSRTGNLTFTDSASGSPQSVALSGTGVATTKTLEFYPSAGANFGDNVPVGIQSGTITVYAQNAGTSTINIDRVVTTGDFIITSNGCNNTSLAGTTEDGTGSLSYCSVNVNFKPTAAGLRTGTLSFVDSAGNSPQSVALSGNALADTGTAGVYPTQLDFSGQAVGTTSATQPVQIVNPGNDTITIDGYKTGTGNFSVTNNDCPAVPFGLTPGNYCYVEVQFTPSATGSLTDMLTVTGSIGTGLVALSGSGVAEAKTIGITPASPMNSGSVVVGQSSGTNGNSDGQAGDLVSIRNTGTAAVTFSASPVINGVNATEFTLYNPNSCGISGSKLQPGASCPMWITFKPAGTGGATATLTFTDDATGTTQVLTLNGTGITSNPTYSLSNNLINFDNETEGVTSATNTYIRFYNNSGSSVILGNTVLSSGFLVPGNGGQTCNGQTIANGGTCYSYISFAPTTSGLITGSITFKNSGGTTLATANLSGYAPTPSLSGLLTPSTLDFTSSQVVTTTSGYLTTVFTNTSNAPLTIGAVTGTNLGAAPTDEFNLYSNGCGPQTLNPGGTCTIYITFTANGSGARTGSLTLPVTYSGGTTASFKVNFTGTGVAKVDSAVMQPGNGTFVDETVGVQSPYVVTLYLINRGNLPYKVGTVVGTNTIVGVSSPGEFAAESAEGGYDGCSGQTLSANTGYCQMNVTFTPSATGTRNGSMSFPVTFADNTTANVVATLTGNGVAAAPTLQFLPGSLEFAPEIINNTSGQTAITVKNIGNKTVHFSSIAVPSAGFVLGTSQDGCYALSLNNLTVGNTCTIYVAFAPTATGNITGALTINDNANGGPHKLVLTGTAIAANQQIALSQTALTFPSQPQSSTSSPQVVYVTNQSDSQVSNLTATLGGTNPTDYQLTNGCPGSLAARAVCTLTIKFSPSATSTGTRTATIVVSDSDSGSPRTITLTGTAIPPGPAVAITPPSPLTFTTVQNVGTTSPTKGFSVTNTGTTNLTITSVTIGGTDPNEFAIVSDGCSGAVLTPSQNCVVGLQFSPALGGTRTAVASVFDSATGSPQLINIVGTGHGIPSAVLSSSSLSYANTYIGTTTASQIVTLTNPGTDTLKITGIAITGPNAGDFTTPVTTCGSTLAPAGSCTLSTAFDPKAVGSRTGAITITDNANNVNGSTESVTLNGTGLGIPTASLSATTLTFPGTFYGTTDATAMTLTLTNTGTATLDVASVTISGTTASDFAESNNCGDIAASGTCVISVTFTPGAVGSRTASLSIVDNSGNVAGTTQTITLNGTGEADVSVTSSVGFGNVSYGTTKTVDVTVSNVGTIPNLNVSAASSGSSVIVLSTGNTCTSGIAPGKSCTLPLEYDVTSLGAETNSVTVTTNGGTNPVIATTGTGTSDVSVSTTSLGFGTITHGTTKTINLTVMNVGTLPSLTVSPAISGTGAADFTVLTTGNTCTSGVAPGASCVLPVEFRPAAAASYAATLTVTTNGGANPVVSLTGTGD